MKHLKKYNKKIVQDVLVIHKKKLEEFTNQSIEKQIKSLKNKLLKITEADSVNEKKNKIRQNDNIFKKIDYLKSGQNELDYISETYDLINKYIQLENDIQELLNSGFIDEVYKLNKEKTVLTNRYLRIIGDSNFLDNEKYTNHDRYLCNNLACEENILEANDGFYVCHSCGYCQQDIQISDDPCFKDLQEREYKTQFTYQKETHLDDWLKRFQAKENKDIPNEIIDKVILEAHKQRITDLSTLTEIQVKRYLKKLKLNDYYDNVINIINRINKRPPFLLTTEVETKIKEMFKQIQEPFQKYKDPSRKNMLSYSYLLHHFFLILGLPEFSKYFFLLKSPDKLRQQDQTFKKIIDELAVKDSNTPWKFYPSI